MFETALARFSFDAYLRAILRFIIATAENLALRKHEVESGVKIRRVSSDVKRI